MKKIFLALSLVSIFFAFTKSALAQVKQMDLSATSVPVSGGYLIQQIKKVDHDILITGIHLETSPLPVGTNMDSGLGVLNSAMQMATGATISLNATRTLVGGKVVEDVDLSQTPLFVNKNFSIYLPMMIYRPTSATGENHTGKAWINYVDYSGQVKYRTFIIPYMDLGVLPGGEIPDVPYYYSSSLFPLKIKGASLFTSFGGAVTGPKSNTTCLRWFHGQTLVQEKCFPRENLPENGYWQVNSSVMPLDWNVPAGDYIKAASHGDALDIQVNVITEIPANLKVTDDLIVKDYNNIDRNALNRYCDQVAPDKTACKNLYPLADCVSTQSCYTQPQISPADFNSDGKVDINDYNILVGNFGNPYTIFDYNNLVTNYRK